MRNKKGGMGLKEAELGRRKDEGGRKIKREECRGREEGNRWGKEEVVVERQRMMWGDMGKKREEDEVKKEERRSMGMRREEGKREGKEEAEREIGERKE